MIDVSLRDCCFNQLGSFGRTFRLVRLSQPFKHHRTGQQHRCWIGLSLAHDVRRRAVAGLEYRVTITDICRGRHAHTAHQTGAKIRNDVSEHVLGDEYVESPGFAHHVECGCIDVMVVRHNIRESFGAFIENLAEEGHGDKDICFVDTC